MKNVIHRLASATRSAPLRLSMVSVKLQDKLAPTPRAKAIMAASSHVTFVILMLVSSTAFAGQDGIAGMVNQGAEQADSIRKNTGKVCMLLGLFGGLFGISKMVQKGKEGENSHVKASHIVVPLLGGVMLGALGAVMAKVGQSVGLDDSDYGSIPGG